MAICPSIFQCDDFSTDGIWNQQFVPVLSADMACAGPQVLLCLLVTAPRLQHLDVLAAQTRALDDQHPMANSERTRPLLRNLPLLVLIPSLFKTELEAALSPGHAPPLKRCLLHPCDQIRPRPRLASLPAGFLCLRYNCGTALKGRQ